MSCVLVLHRLPEEKAQCHTVPRERNHHCKPEEGCEIRAGWASTYAFFSKYNQSCSLSLTQLFFKNHAFQCMPACWHLVCAGFSSPGFQVVGGENSGRSDLGTIISSITPGGPADVNGCLKPGRLIIFFPCVGGVWCFCASLQPQGCSFLVVH